MFHTQKSQHRTPCGNPSNYSHMRNYFETVQGYSKYQILHTKKNAYTLKTSHVVAIICGVECINFCNQQKGKITVMWGVFLLAGSLDSRGS